MASSAGQVPYTHTQLSVYSSEHQNYLGIVTGIYHLPHAPFPGDATSFTLIHVCRSSSRISSLLSDTL